jgi:hypothetical protein
MVVAGYIVEILFSALKIIPSNRDIVVISQGISRNYTTFLNIVFLLLALVMIIRFLKTGGAEMLKMMDTSHY